MIAVITRSAVKEEMMVLSESESGVHCESRSWFEGDSCANNRHRTSRHSYAELEAAARSGAGTE